jgi:hypothetical protein
MKSAYHGKQEVREMAYHRNGVSGMGFYVGIVHEKDEDGEERDMLVVRFPKESDKKAGAVMCAVFDIAKLNNRDIEFGSNSWRGDYYHATMDKEIDKREVVS